MILRKGLLHYVEVGLLVLLSVPVGTLIGVAGAAANIITPGVFVAAVISRAGGWDPGSLMIFIGGPINAVCCYLAIRGIGVIARFLRRSASDHEEPEGTIPNRDAGQSK